MSNIVIAFSKPEVAAGIKKILTQSGYSVQAVCTTGAQALASVNNLECGILVCLSMPMKVHELLQTIEMMEGDIQRRRRRMRRQPKHRSQEDQQIIRKAKELLMARNSFTEEEAHKYIQKRSMDNGTGLVEVAQMILSLLQEG